MTSGHDRVALSRSALVAIAGTFCLMGITEAAYGPLLEHLSRRFEISLAVAGHVLSTHFAGALLGVLVAMWAMKRVSARSSVLAAMGCLGLGCAGVALAPTWPAFLAAVFVLGIGFGALDIDLNQMVAYSAGGNRSAVLNALNAAFGVGAVAGPILVSRLGDMRIVILYSGGAVLAVGLLPVLARVSGRLPVATLKSARGPATLVGIFVIAYALYVGMEVGVGGWMTSHLESVGQRSVMAATVTSGFWLAMVAGRLVVTLVPARVPPAATVITGSAIASLALLAALIGPAAPVAYIVTGFALAPVFPTGISWLAKLNPGDARATSWLFPATMVGGVLGPGAIGVVIARSGIGWAPVVLSAVAVASLAAFTVAASYGSRRSVPPLSTGD